MEDPQGWVSIYHAKLGERHAVKDHVHARVDIARESSSNFPNPPAPKQLSDHVECAYVT